MFGRRLLNVVKNYSVAGTAIRPIANINRVSQMKYNDILHRPNVSVLGYLNNVNFIRNFRDYSKRLESGNYVDTYRILCRNTAPKEDLQESYTPEYVVSKIYKPDAVRRDDKLNYIIGNSCSVKVASYGKNCVDIVLHMEDTAMEEKAHKFESSRPLRFFYSRHVMTSTYWLHRIIWPATILCFVGTIVSIFLSFIYPIFFYIYALLLVFANIY